MALIIYNVRENWLRWFRHVLLREETETVISINSIYVEGKTRREIQNKMCGDVIESDMRRIGVNKEDVVDRVKWRLG